MLRTSFLAVLLLSGCLWRTKQYAAPPAPAKQAPDVSYSSAPAAGLSRVVIDVAEGPALVENVDAGSVQGHGVVGTGAAAFSGSLEYSRSLCVTPCVVDTKPGVHQLRFTLVNDPSRTSTGFVNLDQDPSIYRHSIGMHHSTRWKGIVGAPLVLAGLALGVFAAGNIEHRYYEGHDPNTDTDIYVRQWNAGAIVGTVAGLGLTALGAWLIYGSVVEEQPGSGVQWHVSEPQTATR